MRISSNNLLALVAVLGIVSTTVEAGGFGANLEFFRKKAEAPSSPLPVQRRKSPPRKVQSPFLQQQQAVPPHRTDNPPPRKIGIPPHLQPQHRKREESPPRKISDNLKGMIGEQAVKNMLQNLKNKEKAGGFVRNSPPKRKLPSPDFIPTEAGRAKRFNEKDYFGSGEKDAKELEAEAKPLKRSQKEKGARLDNQTQEANKKILNVFKRHVSPPREPAPFMHKAPSQDSPPSMTTEEALDIIGHPRKDLSQRIDALNALDITKSAFEIKAKLQKLLNLGKIDLVIEVLDYGNIRDELRESLTILNLKCPQGLEKDPRCKDLK